MKKLIWILIVALCLSGCSVIPIGKEPEKQPIQLESVQENQPDAPEEPISAPVPEEPEEPAYTPIPLLSLGQIRVTVTDYLPDAPGGPTLLLEVQNGTSGTLEFRSGHASIAGVMCDPYWSCTAAAGETVESQLWWGSDRLAFRGIQRLQDLRLELTVTGGDTVLFDDLITFSPEEGEGAAAEAPVFPDFAEQVLAQTEQFTVTAKNFEGGVLVLTVDNAAERELLCAVTDVLADGEPCDPQWAALVMAESTCWSEMEFPADLQPAELTMTLNVYDNTDRTVPTLFSETVTVTIP